MRRAFTLIEFLVCVAIVAIILSLAFGGRGCGPVNVDADDCYRCQQTHDGHTEYNDAEADACPICVKTHRDEHWTKGAPPSD